MTPIKPEKGEDGSWGFTVVNNWGMPDKPPFIVVDGQPADSFEEVLRAICNGYTAPVDESGLTLPPEKQG